MPPKVISGISSCFQLLFQCQGQVAHVLLTRSPLVYPRRGLTVRLACVKHAASVRPEPGSNSPLKSIQIRRNESAPAWSSQLVRSLTKRPMLDLRQSIKGIRTRIAPKASSEHGVFVHYLALTFSTLLSSQVSGAHRASAFGLRLGATTHSMRSGSSSQIWCLARTSCWFCPTGVRGLPDSVRLLTAHLSAHLVGQWVPPGRPLQIN